MAITDAQRAQLASIPGRVVDTSGQSFMPTPADRFNAADAHALAAAALAGQPDASQQIGAVDSSLSTTLATSGTVSIPANALRSNLVIGNLSTVPLWLKIGSSTGYLTIVPGAVFNLALLSSAVVRDSLTVVNSSASVTAPVTIWESSSGLGEGLTGVVDRSTTITAGGSSTVASNPARRLLYLENRSPTNTINFRFGATASAGAGSLVLPPGGAFYGSVGLSRVVESDLLSVFSTLGATFTCFEG